MRDTISESSSRFPTVIVVLICILIPACAGTEKGVVQEPGEDSPLTVPEGGDMSVQDGELRDSRGRTLIVRGMNVLSIHPRTGEIHLPEEEEIRDISRLGINFIRLHLYWGGMVEEDMYRTYSRAVDEFIQNVRSEHIKIIVSFSPVGPFQFRENHWLPEGYRGENTSSFGDEVERFWENETIRQEYRTDTINFFEKGRNRSYLSGIELLRRPYSPDMPAALFLDQKLNAFYRAGRDRISREGPFVQFVSPPVIMPFEEVQIPSVVEDPNMALSFGRIHSVLTPRRHITEELKQHRDSVLSNLRVAVEDRNVPLVFSAIGAPTYLKSGKGYLDRIMQNAIKSGSGWAYWLWAEPGHPYSPQSSSEVTLWQMDLLQRPTPLALPGLLTAFDWSREDGTWSIQMSCRVRSRDAWPLELYVPGVRAEALDWTIEQDGKEIPAFAHIRDDRNILRLALREPVAEDAKLSIRITAVTNEDGQGEEETE